MDSNPYSSPTADDERGNRLRPVGSRLRHRVFSQSWFYFGISSRSGRAALRLHAEEFVNSELGAENVVSIVEQNTPTEVVVWYREV